MFQRLLFEHCSSGLLFENCFSKFLFECCYNLTEQTIIYNPASMIRFLVSWHQEWEVTVQVLIIITGKKSAFSLPVFVGEASKMSRPIWILREGGGSSECPAFLLSREEEELVLSCHSNA